MLQLNSPVGEFAFLGNGCILVATTQRNEIELRIYQSTNGTLDMALTTTFRMPKLLNDVTVKSVHLSGNWSTTGSWIRNGPFGATLDRSIFVLKIGLIDKPGNERVFELGHLRSIRSGEDLEYNNQQGRPFGDVLQVTVLYHPQS